MHQIEWLATPIILVYSSMVWMEHMIFSWTETSYVMRWSEGTDITTRTYTDEHLVLV